MPRKIRELVADLERAGFRQAKGGKGSHRKFDTTRREKHVQRALAALKP